ncbi:unnamed protein product [Phytophthora fragariaefolia]|uniref:Unnamed protein product n=1 Tax=Phytophthora fragariaefolia TaxID=1490495 RepID=A0A9W6XM63_9STRA|nr:unnamed protein product [Phytophthora fragariaefolia]
MYCSDFVVFASYLGLFVEDQIETGRDVSEHDRVRAVIEALFRETALGAVEAHVGGTCRYDRSGDRQDANQSVVSLTKPTQLLLTVVVVTILLSKSAAVEIRLFPTQPSALQPRYKKFTFSDVQVCYSLDSCYSKIAVKAAWLGIPLDTHFIFYTGSKCTGRILRIDNFIPNGMVDFTKVGFANKLSSFMLAHFSHYEIKETKSICQNAEDALSVGAPGNISLQP